MIASVSTSLGVRRRAFLVTSDDRLRAVVLSLWYEEEMEWTVFEKGGTVMENLFTDPPDLLVVDFALPDMTGADMVRFIKSENVYRQLPVVLSLPREEILAQDWSTTEADDFILQPFNGAEIKSRLTLTLARASRTLDANPLTKLPGNTTIIQHIQDRLDRSVDFALAYVDLDNFKSYNDKYGFSRGDEALMMSARVVVNIIRSLNVPETFVGHVGGDDFVFVVPADIAEDACKRIVTSFDAIVPSFYDTEDRRQGYILSTDRQGTRMKFPLMAVSIAVVINRDGRLNHYGEVTSIAAGLKKKAKAIEGSSYFIDRRMV